jgi:glycosyltransferase involved in cell wall biosynthesis
MNQPVGPGVLHVVLNLDPGGTERLVIELCSRLRGRFRTAVCCLDSPGAWAPEVEAVGTPVFALGRHPGFRPALGIRLAAIAQAQHMRVLHCHHYSPFVYASVAKVLRPSLRVLYTEHGRLHNGAPSRKRQLGNYLLRAMPYGIYAVSDNLRQHMLAEGFVGREVRVIRNGITPLRRGGCRDRTAVRRELGLEAGGPVIGSVGRLDPVKGLDVLVIAFAEVWKACPPARLLIVGEGSDRDRLVRLAHELGCADAVRFAGHRPDVTRMLDAIDIYVNSSLFEGISLTILEAMAAGKPVIATSVGGNPEIVRDGVNGVMVPPADPHSLARAIQELCADPDRAKVFGDAGRLRVDQQFTIDRMVEDYAREYERAGA